MTEKEMIEEMAKVIDNVQKGGCGASCGYSFTKREAKKKWNRRVDDGK